MPLKNTKHEIFAQEVAKGSALEEAYVRAGYSKSRKNAQRLRINEGIRRRIEEIQNQTVQECGVTFQKIVGELAKSGFSNISDYLNSSDSNISLVDLSVLSNIGQADQVVVRLLR